VIWTALKMLTGDRGKYLGIIFGLSFAGMLIAQQLSIFCGIMQLMVSQVQDVKGVDAWAMDRDITSADDYKPMSENTLYRIRGVPGVQWAVPYFKSVVQVRLNDASTPSTDSSNIQRNISYKSLLGLRMQEIRSKATIYQQCFLIGVDENRLIGAPGPERVLIGNLDRLRRPDSVLVDKYSCQLLWPDEARRLKTLQDYERFIDRTFEIGSHRVIIVGICKAPNNFGTLPTMYATYSHVKQILSGQSKVLAFIVMKLAPGASTEEVGQEIAARTGDRVKVRTHQDLIWDTIWYNIRRTGIAMNFAITVVLGFIVGTAIAGQTFYQFTIENLKQFAALKAMGTGNRTILGMILLQALVVGPIGYGLGVGLAALFGLAVKDDPKVAFFMPWQVLVFTGLSITLICVLSSLVSVRRVLAVEPAIVFRN
jgi:putative ABC transport system permease protein